MGERLRPALKSLLSEGRIRRSRASPEMILKEIQGARKDLETARKSLNEADYKWATIQAYYSIFHAARALLYNRGFRERSHRGLLAALRLLYPASMLGPVLDDFSEAMTLREEADYGLIYSEESAETVVESAMSFLNESKTILKKTRSAEKTEAEQVEHRSREIGSKKLTGWKETDHEAATYVQRSMKKR
jgi:uncharacterized protein (UPF0332 family)